MNKQDAIIERRALAEIVAPAYAANPKVVAVLLAGSVARGIADQFSDIDIFWHAPPTEADRRAPIERSGWEPVYSVMDETLTQAGLEPYSASNACWRNK